MGYYQSKKVKMLTFFSDNADLIIASVQMALTADMLPTLWHQVRAKTCSVPLTSSIPTSVGLAVLGLVFFASGMYVATSTVLLGSIVWGLVAAQRKWYNVSKKYETHSPDTKLRPEYSRLCSPSSDDSENTWN